MKTLTVIAIILVLMYYIFLYLRYRKNTRATKDILVQPRTIEIMGKSKFNMEQFRQEISNSSQVVESVDASNMFEIKVMYEEEEKEGNDGISFEEMQVAVDIIKSEEASESEELEAGEILSKLRGTEVMHILVEQMEDNRDRISRLMDNYIGKNLN